jgi:copper homeostasis protein
MPENRTLEVSVETIEAAVAAERAGADRIELCGNLSIGGVTPSAELMSAVHGQLRIPVFTMIRPRGGDFVYSPAEFAAMKEDIGSAKKYGMNGVVLGILHPDRHVDVIRTRQLVELALPLPTTFHRAFDESVDFHQALEDVIKTGAARILTSGGAAGAPEGMATLAEMVAAVQGRIVVVPGGRINASNIVRIAEQTRAREFHSALGTVVPYGNRDYTKFEVEVRKLRNALGLRS